MARYVITGGAGFLGSHLTDRLLADQHNVIAIDNLVTGDAHNLEHLKSEPRFEFIEKDISQAFPDMGKIDGIFHFASPASPKDFLSLAIPILEVGSLGTLHALAYAKRFEAWFLMASTSEVYGDPLVHPQPETYLGNVNPVGVRGVYDEAKRFAEALTMAYSRTKKVKTSIVRIFNTYGPRMRMGDGRVIPNFISQALRGEPLTVNGQGTQTRSFCYVDDLIEGILRFAALKPIDPINLGNDREISIRNVADLVIHLTGSSSSIQEVPLPEGDPKRRCPNLTRAKEILDWQPTTQFESGLEKTIDYFRKRL